MIGDREPECRGQSCEGCNECAEQCGDCLDIVPVRDMQGSSGYCVDCWRERGENVAY